MNREIHVRLCERLGAKFPGPTRRRVGDHSPYADCPVAKAAAAAPPALAVLSDGYRPDTYLTDWTGDIPDSYGLFERDMLNLRRLRRLESSPWGGSRRCVTTPAAARLSKILF
jgi:hypothetical protein